MKKIKIKGSMSRKEQQIVERSNDLKYPTDRLGPGSLLTQQSHTNASRLIMVNHNLPHMVSIKDPEMPLVPTGFENVLASYSSMLDKTKEEYRIIAKFEKNPYTYVLIGVNDKSKTYHAWVREELEEHSEGFATRYNNKYIDSLEVGDVVPEGTYIKKSTNFDKYMNYCFGRNLNTVYLVSTLVHEDGITLMNGAERMMVTARCHTITITVSENEVLLNWYGDKNHYRALPKIGEKARKGYLAIVRQIDSSNAPYSLKRDKLRMIERGDRKYHGKGRVIDIDVRVNKDPSKLAESEINKEIYQLYVDQQKYYTELYRYMIHLKDTMPDDYKLSDEFTIICDDASRYVDASAFFADSNDNIYGNMQITVRLLEEEPLTIGSKIVGRYANKGVARIVSEEESWHMEDGTPIHCALAALGIVGRLNQSQENEHSINELGATAVREMKATTDLKKKGKIIYDLMTYLNSDEAEAFKQYYKSLSDKEKASFCRKTERDGIIIVQDPIENADITDIERAYDRFKPNYQRIVFADGTKSMRKVLCSKMFFIRLKQDPVDKYSARSRGPVNPLTTLPAKSSRKKKNLDAYSDVPVRVGELDKEVQDTMVNHPAANADFMTENSTSLESKMAASSRQYLGDLDDRTLTDEEIMVMEENARKVQENPGKYLPILIESSGVVYSSKKNLEQIDAYLNVLGTKLVIETEEAPEGEYFED